MSDQTDKIYIGSTAEKYLSQRIGHHRRDFKAFQEGRFKVNLASFQLLQFDDAKAILIESYPCNSKDELHAREQYWIELNQDKVVNKCKAHTGMAKEEYDNLYRKAYSEKVKIFVSERPQEELTQTQKRKQVYAKRDYEKHQEEIRARVKIYREANAEKIKARRNETKLCDCGKTYTHSNFNRHCVTKHHQAFLAQNSTPAPQEP